VGEGSMRTMFTLCLVFVIGGLAYFMTVGLTHR
jgi:uncharacterized protein YjeT (DUF2065 family)